MLRRLGLASAFSIARSAEQIAEPSWRLGKMISAVDTPYIGAATWMDRRRQYDIAAVTPDIETRSDRTGAVPDRSVFASEEDVAAARRNAFHGFG